MSDRIEIIEEVTTIEIDGEESLTSVESSLVEIVSEAQQGIAGPPGIDGVAQVFEAVFSSSSIWIVNHNLGHQPIASVLNTGGMEILGDIIHTNVNQFIVYFAVPTAGKVKFI